MKQKAVMKSKCTDVYKSRQSGTILKLPYIIISIGYLFVEKKTQDAAYENSRSIIYASIVLPQIVYYSSVGWNHYPLKFPLVIAL